jgi:hypothetical protein
VKELQIGLQPMTSEAIEPENGSNQHGMILFLKPMLTEIAHISNTYHHKNIRVPIVQAASVFPTLQVCIGVTAVMLMTGN